MFSSVASRHLPSSVCCTLARSGSTVTTSGILEQYQKLVHTQELQPDPRQLHVAERLQQLQDKLISWQPPPVEAYDEWINHNPVEINAHDADALPGYSIHLLLVSDFPLATHSPGNVS